MRKFVLGLLVSVAALLSEAKAAYPIQSVNIGQTIAVEIDPPEIPPLIEWAVKDGVATLKIDITNPKHPVLEITGVEIGEDVIFVWQSKGKGYVRVKVVDPGTVVPVPGVGPQINLNPHRVNPRKNPVYAPLTPVPAPTPTPTPAVTPTLPDPTPPPVAAPVPTPPVAVPKTLAETVKSRDELIAELERKLAALETAQKTETPPPTAKKPKRVHVGESITFAFENSDPVKSVKVSKPSVATAVFKPDTPGNMTKGVVTVAGLKEGIAEVTVDSVLYWSTAIEVLPALAQAPTVTPAKAMAKVGTTAPFVQSPSRVSQSQTAGKPKVSNTPRLLAASRTLQDTTARNAVPLDTSKIDNSLTLPAVPTSTPAPVVANLGGTMRGVVDAECTT